MCVRALVVFQWDKNALGFLIAGTHIAVAVAELCRARPIAVGMRIYDMPKCATGPLYFGNPKKPIKPNKRFQLPELDATL